MKRGSMKLELAFEGATIRMVGTAEEPKWVAKDVCRVLSIRGAADALRNADVTTEERGSVQLDTPGGPQWMTTVRESGLWKLVLASRKPSAQRFKHWVASDVLPSIRKHGCYPPPAPQAVAPAIDLTDIQQLIPIASQLANLVQEMLPKAKAYDRFEAAGGAVSLSQAGRILRRKPRLFIIELYANGVLFRGRAGALEPAHQFRERGYFKVRATEVEGRVRVQTLVTPRGLQWLSEQYGPEDDAGGCEIERTMVH